MVGAYFVEARICVCHNAGVVVFGFEAVVKVDVHCLLFFFFFF